MLPWPWEPQPKPQKLSRKMFESSRAVFSLSRSRKISELSPGSHKNFHFKKLRLLENLESDSNGDGNDDTGKTFRILQEVAAYLIGPCSSDRGRENVSGALLETPL